MKKPSRDGQKDAKMKKTSRDERKDATPAKNAKDARRDRDGNQGEGDRASARSYEAKLKEFIAKGKVDRAAHDAARAVDSTEGRRLREAEKKGKARAKTGLVGAVMGVGRAFVQGARAALHEARNQRAARRSAARE
ncbi:MAG TPA: hypothetical protein VM734_18995 [Kofleriaceae bacterium]|jgi:hypothetical protein|nr:hypothetical protein [Kofleriaceae bacterium]